MNLVVVNQLQDVLYLDLFQLIKENLFENKDITNLNSFDMRKIRKDIQMIFQDPFSSLNPRMKIGNRLLNQ